MSSTGASSQGDVEVATVATGAKGACEGRSTEAGGLADDDELADGAVLSFVRMDEGMLCPDRSAEAKEGLVGWRLDAFTVGAWVASSALCTAVAAMATARASTCVMIVLRGGAQPADAVECGVSGREKTR